MNDMIIDAHQHVWDPAAATYDWLGPELAPIDRAFRFEELLPSIRRAGVDGTVLVQSADNAEDTQLMIATADAHPEVKAIVAYVPLDRPEVAAEQLARFASDPRIVGIRNLIHTRSDPDWILRPDVDAGLSLVEAAGLTFDLVAVLPRHLEHVATLVHRHPDLRIVIDHLAKPPIGLPDREPWWSLIATAAQSPRVFAKVSGLYSATPDSAAWTPDSVRPFVDHAAEIFGVDRLMYGGDWPISILSGGYDRVWDGLSEIFSSWTSEERSRVCGGTARDFYRIPDSSSDVLSR